MDKAFQDKVIETLTEHGAVKVATSIYERRWQLLTHRGTFSFYLFQPQRSSVYNILCRLTDSDQPVRKVAEEVNCRFGMGLFEPMNPFSGKFNIHEYEPETALQQLRERICWLKIDPKSL